MIKRTIYISEEDYAYMKSNGLSPSHVAREAIIEAMKGRLRTQRKYGRVRNPKVIRVRITEEQDRFIREKNINLSALVREKVKTLRAM